LKTNKASFGEAKTKKMSLDASKTLGVSALRVNYNELRKALKEEGEVVLTTYGKPFARVLPLEPLDTTKLNIKTNRPQY